MSSNESGEGKAELIVPDVEPSALWKAAEVANQAAAGAVGAGIALGGSPVAAIVGGAAVPAIQAAGSRIMQRRSKKVRERLLERRVSLEQLIELVQKDEVSLDLFNGAVEAALRTGDEAKRRLLVDVMADGILSGDVLDKAYARRVVTTLARIDAVEVLVLGAIDRAIGEEGEEAVGHSDNDLSWQRIRAALDNPRSDVVDGGLAVLQSEGLVRLDGAASSAIVSLTDYGRRLLSALQRSS